MSHPDNALQKGLYDRLVGYGPLTTALGGPNIFDVVPQSSTPPYVVIGDETWVEWDTKTEHGWDGTITLHAYVFEVAGRKQIKTILGLIYDALHQQEASIPILGFNLLMVNYEFSHTYLQDGIEGAPDKSWHGVMRFRCLVTD